MTDHLDLKILAQLQKDCRISNADLAASLGLSASACWRRVRALEENGAIENYAAVVNPAKIGLNFHAIVHVQLARHDPGNIKTFINAIRARREVEDCYATTGQADYHLKILCRDIEAYNAFLEEFLFLLPGVQNAQTNLILRDIKRSAPSR